MSALLEHIIDTKQLRMINNVRTYLQITFLSDLCHYNSTIIKSEYIRYDKVAPRQTANKSKLSWPTQDPPLQTAWHRWVHHLRKFLMNDDCSLKTEIGHWIPRHVHQRHHNFLYSPEQQLLHKFSDDQSYGIVKLTRRTIIIDPNKRHPSISTPTVPVEPTLLQSNEYFLTKHAAECPNETSPNDDELYSDRSEHSSNLTPTDTPADIPNHLTTSITSACTIESDTDNDSDSEYTPW